MEGANCRVVFEKGGVYLHTSAKKHQDPDSLIAGVIRVVEKDSDVLLHWAPVEEAGDSTQIFFSKKLKCGVWSKEGVGGAEPHSPQGSWAFSVSLGELKSIRRSKPGLSWAYLVLVTQAGGSLPALHFHRGGTRALLRVLSRYLLLASSPQDSRLYLVFPHDSSALSNSFHHLQLFDQDSSNVVSRFLQDPYSTTFSSFSRVTNFFRGALQPHPEGVSPDLPPPPDDEPEPGFEVISCVELGPRPAVERAPPVTEEEWARHVGPEGRLQQVSELKNRIFSGGLSPGLRREAWKFLLGYLSWEGSAEEHKTHVRKKTDEYFRMKLQWKSVSPEQEQRNSLLHGYRSLIGGWAGGGGLQGRTGGEKEGLGAWVQGGGWRGPPAFPRSGT
ncbi:PREDICTED: TBC1 domain family member 17-like, partial [Galeopterus variegatus]|uniref:TBC1 domain family member 17-like n=1 Tax=Galeopterus variegatus TaxID=482537 RepID=A0ABM0S8E6_GALVR